MIVGGLKRRTTVISSQPQTLVVSMKKRLAYPEVSSFKQASTEYR